MKTKILSLLTLLVVCVTGAWAEITPKTITSSTGEVYMVNPANMFSYYNSGNGWVTNASGGEISSKSYYSSKNGSNNTNYINPESEETATSNTAASGITLKTADDRSARFYFTGAVKATAFIAITGSGRTATITIYKKSDNTVVSSKTGKSYGSSGSYEKLEITGLSSSETYYAKVTATNDLCLYAMKFFAPSGPSITAQTIVDANYVQGTDASSVTALSVTASASAGDLSYQWYKNTANSTTTPEPTAINEATSSSYKPSTTEASTLYYFCKVSDDNGYVYSSIAAITVAEASAPIAISVSGNTSAARGASAIVLTASVTGGVPDPTIEWFKCDDGNGTTPISQGSASTSNTTFDVATSTVGTYYYYAEAANSQGNVSSAVKTITIVPQVPTITAGGVFVDDSKSVEISKADGEDGSAVIKYSTNNGTTWSDYNAALNVTETTTVQAKVVQSGLESEVVSATFTKFVKSTLESISSATTWNWESWTETLELGASSDPIGTEEYTYSDIATIKSLTLPSGFNGATIAYKGVSGTNNYPVRNKKAQAIGLHINITVPGTLTIKFSDTGSSGDSHNRYLNINGTNTEYYTCRHDSKNDTKTVTITGVPAGDVWIKAVKDDGSTETMVVFYSVTFTPVTSVSGTISSIGWNSFASAYPLDLSDISGGTAFYASAVEDNIVTLTSTDAKVPAGTGLLIRGTAGDEFTISTTSAATTPLSNILVGTTAVTDVDASSVYVLAGAEEGKPYFQLYSGTSIVANKAYIASGSVSSPDRIRFVIEGEQNATGMEDVKAGVDVIKFIENSQLLIKKNGIVYDVTGRIVK